METRTGIGRAIAAAGSQRNLARALGVTDQAISLWVKAGSVPLVRMRDVSRLTGVPIGDLLMDVQGKLEASTSD